MTSQIHQSFACGRMIAINLRVGLSKMSIVEQSESDDIFVSGMKAKELMITVLSVLLFLLQRDNENVDLIIMSSLIFCIQIRILSDLLCPILP